MNAKKPGGGKMLIGSKMKKMMDPSRMIKTYRDRVMFLEFVNDEWKRLMEGEKLTRVNGDRSGYYKIEVKVTRIPDPYEVKP